ncbi:MAG: hypothetical protein ABJN84_14945 [Flavobacteriaceae bacterium]
MMVNTLIGIVISFWIYKLIKIIHNSKELNSFSRECLDLTRRKGGLMSEQFELGAEHYKSANRKITISKLIWFFIEVASFVGIYFIFIG